MRSFRFVDAHLSFATRFALASGRRTQGGHDVKNHSSRVRFVSFVCTLTALMIVGVIATSPAQAQTTFSGRAFAAFVSTALTGPIFISDTGQLSPSGGFRSDALLDTRDLELATLNNLLTAEVLAASTSGASGKAESSASLAN